jgi:DeoR family glycerol-3-phosphate regulon repressor
LYDGLEKLDMKRDERHSLILERLYHEDSVTVEYLATYFDVSLETIRRDLTTLAEAGLLRKIHGGAVRFQTAREDTFALRSQVNRAAKEAIGQYATHFVKSGDSVFMNAGTTTTVFAEALTQRENLTIITNCASVANTMWQDGNGSHTIFLLGGQYNGTDTETYGSLVLQQLRMFRADHAFITLGALNAEQGCMEYRVEAAEIIRAMTQQACQTTALVDSTKMGNTALVKVCDLSTLTRIVTEFTPSEALQSVIQEQDVELHVTGLVTTSP